MSAMAIAGRRRPASTEVLTALAVLAGAAVIGLGIGVGRTAVIGLAVLPLLLGFFVVLAGPARMLIIPIALAMAYLGGPFVARNFVGAVGVFPSDFLIIGAVGGFILEVALKRPAERPRLPRTMLIGIPLIIFFVAILLGAIRGHERYGSQLFGNPMRLVLYSAIVLTLPGLTPQRALRYLTFVTYAGSVVLALIASYHIATGTSATVHDALSTGGMRYIGVSAATYSGVAFVMAILNLAAGKPKPLVHLAFALIAGFDVIVAYTRSVWLATAAIFIIAIAISPAVRGVVLASVPVVTPVLLAGALLVLTVQPSLATTLMERVSTPAGQDTSVQWRAQAYKQMLAGTSEDPVRGIGFGRVINFRINHAPVRIDSDPHNGFIYIYAGAGVLGAAGLILLNLTYLGVVARRWRRSSGDARQLLAFSVCAWALVLSHAMSEPMLTIPSVIIVLWSCLVLPLVVVPEDPRAPRPSAVGGRRRLAVAARLGAPTAPLPRPGSLTP